MPPDELSKAVDFTNIEIVCLAVWLEDVLQGDIGKAGRVLATGLLVEHYRSLLPNDPAQFSTEQAAILTVLHRQFADALGRGVSQLPQVGLTAEGGLDIRTYADGYGITPGVLREGRITSREDDRAEVLQPKADPSPDAPPLPTGEGVSLSDLYRGRTD